MSDRYKTVEVVLTLTFDKHMLESHYNEAFVEERWRALSEDPNGEEARGLVRDAIYASPRKQITKKITMTVLREE